MRKIHDREGRVAASGRRRAAAALMLAGFLAACGGGQEEQIARRLPCPSVAVLGETDSVTIFAGQGRDLIDIAYQAEINRAVTQCEYDLDDGIIYFDVALSGIAAMGPAATSRETDLKVFMAVTEIDRSVLRKQVMAVPVEFEDGKREVRFVQTVEESVLPYVEGIDGSAYQVLVGFQLTRDQLAHNRRAASRR